MPLYQLVDSLCPAIDWHIIKFVVLVVVDALGFSKIIPIKDIACLPLWRVLFETKITVKKLPVYVWRASMFTSVSRKQVINCERSPQNSDIACDKKPFKYRLLLPNFSVHFTVFFG